MRKKIVSTQSTLSQKEYQILHEILSIKRSHESEGEKIFVDKFIMPLNPKVYTDNKGYVLAYVLCTDPKSDIMFSSHVDTVHKKRDAPPNNVLLNEERQFLYKNDGTPLGADDGAGIWLLLQMIEANVPGYYIFHRGEERGGVGSKGMAAIHSRFISKFNAAIAFDRQGKNSVITHQGGERCASNAFCQALADSFNRKSNMSLSLDATGIYTDTKEYVYNIPECTNVSIGYHHQHSGNEIQELQFLAQIKEACLRTNFNDLPIRRQIF
jgi:hypothetical protein